MTAQDKFKCIIILFVNSTYIFSAFTRAMATDCIYSAISVWQLNTLYFCLYSCTPTKFSEIFKDTLLKWRNIKMKNYFMAPLYY